MDGSVGFLVFSLNSLGILTTLNVDEGENKGAGQAVHDAHRGTMSHVTVGAVFFAKLLKHILDCSVN